MFFHKSKDFGIIYKGNLIIIYPSNIKVGFSQLSGKGQLTTGMKRLFGGTWTHQIPYEQQK